MKNVILGLVVLLGLFMLWNESSTEVVIVQPIEVKKIQEKEEIFSKVDEFIDEPLEEMVLRKSLIVDAGMDVNITKENNVTLTVALDDNGTYNYVWKENENIVGLGKVLTKAYDKGEHLLTVEVLEAGEFVGQDEVKVTAWDYLKTEKMYLADEDEFYTSNTKIYDHHNWLLFVEYLGYSKTTYVYNDGGEILEERYEQFDDYNQSYTLLYTYDDENNMLSMERLDVNENVLESIFYDENGNEIILSLEEHKEVEEYEDDGYVDNSIRTYNQEGMLIRREINDDGYKSVETRRYKDGKLVFRELFDGDKYYIYNYKYNEKGLRILRKSTTKDTKGNMVWMRSSETEYSEDDMIVKELRQSFYKYEENIHLSTFITEYSKEGNRLKYERKSTYNDEVRVHVRQGWKYDKEDRVIEENAEALEGVCPCTSDVVKEKTVYTYDKEGNVLKEQYQSQKVNEESLQKEETSMKVVTSYTNTL